MKTRTTLIATCLAVLACTPVMAHPQTAFSHPHGLFSGFAHPWLGLDHLLAMFAVGLLSVRMSGKALWLLPVTFLSFLLLGGTAAVTGMGFPGVEFGIGLALVLLGAGLAARRRVPLLAAIAVAGMAGLFHGHAHGTEIPFAATPVLYAAGLFAATATLHAAGIVVGCWLNRGEWRLPVFRLGGAAISGVGLLLLGVL